jgi:hypothetical protein
MSCWRAVQEGGPGLFHGRDELKWVLSHPAPDQPPLAQLAWSLQLEGRSAVPINDPWHLAIDVLSFEWERYLE